MSEPTTATATGRPPRPPGAKYAGLTRNQWIGVGVVFVVVAGVIIWRRHAAGSAASPSSGSGSGSGDCTDANGNSVPCDQADLSGELSALQTELETLMAAEGTSGGGGTGGGTVTIPSGGTDPGTGSSTSTGTGTGTGTGTATKTTTPAKSGTPAKTLAAPGGVHATKTTTSSITLAWDKVAGATGYRIRVTYQSKLVKQQTVAGTTATISGLTADHTYGIHLASISAAGTGPENDTDIKTAKL